MDASSLYVFDGDRTYLVKYPIDDFQLTIDPSSLNSRNIKWIITYYPNIGKELTELEKVRIGYYRIIHKMKYGNNTPKILRKTRRNAIDMTNIPPPQKMKKPVKKEPIKVPSFNCFKTY